MCEWWSCIVLKDGRVFHSMNTSSHERLLAEIQVKTEDMSNAYDFDSLTERDYVAIEILPKDYRYVFSNERENWKYKVDEEMTLPKWYKDNEVEFRLKVWKEWERTHNLIFSDFYLNLMTSYQLLDYDEKNVRNAESLVDTVLEYALLNLEIKDRTDTNIKSDIMSSLGLDSQIDVSLVSRSDLGLIFKSYQNLKLFTVKTAKDFITMSIFNRYSPEFFNAINTSLNFKIKERLLKNKKLRNSMLENLVYDSFFLNNYFNSVVDMLKLWIWSGFVYGHTFNDIRRFARLSLRHLIPNGFLPYWFGVSDYSTEDDLKPYVLVYTIDRVHLDEALKIVGGI